ncbi:miscellaneous; hypothetical/partial homology [plant metagenome]|uniref:Miscellaneous hypothetical/partial homology n=1 Tax=plant metagenome TaxID=1297885 RepID=A0A484VAI2_9ZZZZ
MTVEADIFQALQGLVDGRVYPDQAPEQPQTPFIMYSQVGGRPINFLSGVPGRRNGRFQVNVWAGTRDEASGLIRQVEDVLRLDSRLLAVTLSGALSDYAEPTGWHGSQQDFSIWFTD